MASSLQVKAALFRNALAGGAGKISLILFRIVQVPLLLSALGVEEYGRWLVLASLPTWLTLANLGFGSVAANEMSMAVAALDLPRARSVFSTTLALLAVLSLLGTAIIVLLAPLIPWETMLNVSTARHSEMTAAVLWLGLAVLISFFGDVFYGCFRAARKAHQGVLLNSIRPWADLVAMIAALHYGTRFDHLALALLCSAVIFNGCYYWLSRRSMPELSCSLRLVQPARFHELFKKGIAFQAFPLGNAVLFQGNLLVVQATLGPVAVALFGTARTLIRSVNQAMDLVNQAIWPELSHLLGSGDLSRAARLHRLAVVISVTTAILSVVGLAVFGQTLYGWWTGKAIELPQYLLLLFLLPIPFNALWFTSSVVHVACNQHEGLAVRYVAATCLSVAACIFLSSYMGIEGAALSTLVVDLVLIPYVLKRSLLLTGDSWLGFAQGVAHDLRSTVDLLRRSA